MNTVFFFNPDSSNICVLRKYICSQSFVRFWQRKPIHTLTYLEDRTALRIFPILYYLGIYLFVVWCCFHSKSELKSWNRTHLYPFCPVDRFMYPECQMSFEHQVWTSQCSIHLLEFFLYYLLLRKVIWRKNISMDRTQFPILSNRQIYPENQRKSKSDLTNNAGSTTSLNSESNYGSRKFLNLIQDGSKFCLVQQNNNTLGEWKKYY